MLDQVKTALAIEANIHAIARHGYLVPCTKPGCPPSYRIRFRVARSKSGKTAHRSITLGSDPKLLFLAREAIAIKELTRTTRMANKARHADFLNRMRILEAEIMPQITGSRRYRQSVRKALREYCSGSPAPSANDFLAGIAPPRPRRRRGGRPLRSRLW